MSFALLLWIVFVISILLDLILPSFIYQTYSLWIHIFQLSALALAIFSSKKILQQRFTSAQENFFAATAASLEKNADGKTPEEKFQSIHETILRMRALVAESKSKESAVVENAVDVIGLIDVNSCFVTVNPAANTVLGYAPAELIGRSINEFILAGDADSTINSVLAAKTSIEKIAFENRWKRKDGNIVNLLWSAHWSASDHALFCVVHDITERKRAEALLQQSEERLRLILECLPISVFITNRFCTIELANSAAERVSGYTREELAGASLHLLMPQLINPTTPATFLALADSSTAHGKESLVTKKSGETVPVEFSMTKFETGNECKYILAVLDITERYELDKAKREFVAMISHDINTPLNSILLTLNILSDGKLGQLSEKGEKRAREALDETRRLIKLIKELLDLEKMASACFSMQFEDTSIQEIISHSVAAVKPSAEARNLSIKIASNEARCKADGARLIQVLVNLLSNAIKFSPIGSAIKILIEEKGELIRIAVADSGKGVPEDKQKLIFEKFAQLERKDWQQRGGTGLGLAICKIIIEQHHGQIGVENSRSESGSIFWFEIPKTQNG